MTSALKPLLAPPGEKRTCAVCCALLYPAIELKHAALEHLVCDVCACPAQKGSGHVLGSLASVVFFSHITFFAQLITIVSCLFHEDVNHVSMASKNRCRFVVMTWTNSVAGQRLCWNALTCLRLSPHGPVRLPVTLFVVHIAFVFLVFSFHIAIGSLAGCEGVEAESCAAA